MGVPDFVKFEMLRYDFGARPRQEKELSVDFKFVNCSRDSISIKYALPSCGCTTVDWTRSKVAPGGSGVVSVTYHSEFYKFSFDRSVSVFFEGESAPVNLSVCGSYYDTPESLSMDFPVIKTPLAFDVDIVSLGTVCPYKPAVKEFRVANVSDKPLILSFDDFSEGLSLDTPVVKIPALSRSYLYFTVNADSLAWGHRSFTATPSVDGKPLEPVVFDAIVIDDFSSLSRREMNQGAYFKVVGSVHHFGVLRAGSDARVAVTLENCSDKVLKIKSAKLNAPGAEVVVPDSVAARSRGDISIHIPASSLSAGENTMTLALVTNSPLIPYVEIPIQGYVE